VTRRRALVFAATACAVIVADQVTKALVSAAFSVNSSVPVIEGVVSLTHVRNAGAAFGVLQGQRWLFVVTGIVVLATVGIALWRLRPTSKLLLVGLALVSGGAAGNLVDRIVSGRVTDFIDFGWFPVFNVADIALDAGVALIVGWLLFGHTGEAEAVTPGEGAETDSAEVAG
jgi:signal peptidase II